MTADAEGSNDRITKWTTVARLHRLLKAELVRKSVIEIRGDLASIPMDIASKAFEKNEWQFKVIPDNTMPEETVRIRFRCDLKLTGKRISFEKNSEWEFSPPDILYVRCKTKVVLPPDKKVDPREQKYEIGAADKYEMAILETDDNIRYVLDSTLK